jgi:hypothetical protein
MEMNIFQGLEVFFISFPMTGDFIALVTYDEEMTALL